MELTQTKTMGQLAFVLPILLIAIAALLFGALFAKPIASAVRRRIPYPVYEIDLWLLWGLLGLSGLGFLLVAAYLMTRP